MTMVRSILVALGAAACLLAFALLGEQPGGPIARALVGVVLGVGVAALIYGEATFVAVTLGAISPLVYASLERTSLAVASAAMCLLWLMPRFVLATTPRRLAVLVAASAIAAGIAGSIFAAYVEAPWAAHAASCVFAGSCLALVAVLVPVPSTTAFALRTAAAAVDGPIRDVVLGAAETYESSRWQPRPRSARRKWRELVRLLDQRAAIERARGGNAEEQRRELDRRIEAATRELASDARAAVTDAAPAASSGATDNASHADGEAAALGHESAPEETVVALDHTEEATRGNA
jgi:hypothetical protein